MKRIVLVGAGFGCLSVIKSLDKNLLKKYSFTLVNDNSFHYQTTLLHQFASNTNKKVIHPLSSLLPSGVNVVESKVVSIKENMIVTSDGEISFDHLILGIGSEKNTFGINGLDDKNDIGSITNATIVSESIRSKLRQDKPKIDKSVIICGAGLTGVEFAGALSDYVNKNNIDANIMLVEAYEHILPPFTKEEALYAKQVLESNGVSVYENAKIIKGGENSILIEQKNQTQELLASTIVWTAGVKGNVIATKSPFECQNNRVLIDEYCRPKNITDGSIFVIGDCSLMIDESTNRPYPPTAQFAQKQGEYIASILKDVLEGSPIQTKFTYSSKGTVCSLCDSKAVGSVGGKSIYGFKAHMIKKIIDKKWLFKLYGLKCLFM